MEQGEKERPWNTFRYWLMARLLPGGNLGGVAKLVGTHYAIISVIYRLLGAKIGERVYWPGSGLDLVEYDLLEVGDDVVSILICCLYCYYVYIHGKYLMFLYSMCCIGVWQSLCGNDLICEAQCEGGI